MEIIPRLRRPCIKCNKMFLPTGKACRVCDKCNFNIIKEVNKLRRLKGKKKK